MMTLRRLLIGCALVVGMLAPDPRATAAPAWQPTPGTTWQIQFSGDLDTTVDVQAYDVDMFETDASVVEQLHAAGRKVICYISAGSWEKWRPDAASYPDSVKGKPLAGWPGERWLDVRQIAILEPILVERVRTCASKGFDAVEFDNVDGYTQRSGFAISPADQIAFNTMLTRISHEAGLAVGLKNDLEQIPQLVDHFDFAINEECVKYRECELLRPFIDQNKAVFHIEYKGRLEKVCSVTQPLRLSTLKKKRNLDASRRVC